MKKPAVCATVATLLATAACGGDTTTSSPSSTGPHAAFVAAADRECTAAHKTLDARPVPTSIAQIIPYLDTTIQVDGDLERKLRALIPPAQDAVPVATLLDDFEGLLKRAMAARQLAAGGDLAATDQALSDLSLQVATVTAKARRFGFTSCGIPATPKPSGTS